ncbi:alpha/beta-hydrolase [Beauveria brongniartii RCEF 3172]|uniref:Alpha/beta-hydrolase n=1 Tax=Beauveria brongniartii RCEF 3172 TaxID=1081107 RepID=A0A166X7S7_9HYPO|nr:alpha/beta-hydrolase [Beauveria brongniartii RCEF 3172]
MKPYRVLHYIAVLAGTVTAQGPGQNLCPGERLDTLTNDFVENLFNYGESASQAGNGNDCERTLQCATALETNPNGKYWVMFLHGGAWRAGGGVDFLCAVAKMRSRKDAPFDQIRGFATMDYRLSSLGNPFPDQDSGQVSRRQNINPHRQRQQGARHPDHINDVRAAIRSLAQRNQMDQYILVGHSAGGTMAMQLVGGDAALQSLGSEGGRQQDELETPRCQAGGNGTSNTEATQIPLPAAIITTAGIFDLTRLVDEIDEDSRSFYENFVTQAFGSNRDGWQQASPARFRRSYKETWPGDNTVILARSKDDTLVPETQLNVMAEKLRGDGFKPIVVTNLTGEHDIVWEQGTQLANLVGQALGQLRGR